MLVSKQHIHQARTATCARIPRSQVRVQANFLQQVFSGASGASAKQMAPARFFSANAPSWQQLEEMVRAKQAALGVDFYADPELGPTNPTALKRLFGQPESSVRIKLYRDHAAWCPYCHKVWLQLEEKQIPYVMEKINMRCYGDKPASFLSKVPSGLLPVIEIDGRVVTESAVIMDLLEREFPDHKSLMPAQGQPSRMRADALMRLERQFFSVWLNWLCSDWGAAANQARFEQCMDQIDKELRASGGPFFLGTDLSLVDITFVPMLERAVASLAYYKGFYLRGTGRWPGVERWFEALEQRPTYLGTKSDFFTHSHDLPPQLGGCAMTAEGAPVAAQIDGGAWRLPLPPLSSTSLPEPYSPGDNPRVDTLEAAAKLVRNHKAVIRFALRGPGKPGPRPVSAPLADPTAVPALEFEAAGDMALRHTVHALLVGVEAKQVSPEALQVGSEAGGALAADMVAGPAASSARYLQERVGVPRDMRFPAARQLRAHLTWLVETLEGHKP